MHWKMLKYTDWKKYAWARLQQPAAAQQDLARMSAECVGDREDDEWGPTVIEGIEAKIRVPNMFRGDSNPGFPGRTTWPEPLRCCFYC